MEILARPDGDYLSEALSRYLHIITGYLGSSDLAEM